MMDPKLMKPQPPVDRGHRSRPATALPYRAKVLPKPFIAPGRSGAMSARESLTGLSSSASDDRHNQPNRKSVMFAPSVEGGRTKREGSPPLAHAQPEEDMDTLSRAANVGLNTRPMPGNGKVRPDGYTSNPGKRTQNNHMDLKWQHRRVVASRVVHEVIEKPKPFSAWNGKYKQLTKGDQAFGGRAVSGVAASGPYISQYKHDRLEYMKSKQKWVVDKQFRRYFGKASQVIGKNTGAGIVGSGDYREPSDEFRGADDRSKFMNPIRGWRRY